jgi:hypothetical protein
MEFTPREKATFAMLARFPLHHDEPTTNWHLEVLGENMERLDVCNFPPSPDNSCG